MELLKIDSLFKSFHTGSETVEVLRGIDLTVGDGSTVVISGESGSGKTTLLNLAGGLDHPTSGAIYVKGREISRLAEDELTGYRNQTVGFIFQFHFLLGDFTAHENVLMPTYLGSRAPKRSRETARELLAAVGLGGRLNHYPAELSGGERQRVAVARALVNDPQIILADEPTGNLDERNSAVVADLLFELVRRFGKTMLLVSHDRGLAERADRNLELAHGKLVEP